MAFPADAMWCTPHTGINTGGTVTHFKQLTASSGLALQDFLVVKGFQRAMGMHFQEAINEMYYSQLEKDMYG
jgi:hypothetical protein